MSKIIITKIFIFFLFLNCFIKTLDSYVNENSCPQNYKRCYLFDGYGCCPYSNGVCCNDLKHCCPEGYICSDYGGCLKNNSNNIIN
jgi:hypothetical protein